MSSEDVLKNRESTVSVANREKKKVAAADTLKSNKLIGKDGRRLRKSISTKSMNNININSNGNNNSNNNNNNNNNDINNNINNNNNIELYDNNMGYNSTFSSNSPAAAATVAAIAMILKHNSPITTPPSSDYSFKDIYDLSVGMNNDPNLDASTNQRTYDDRNKNENPNSGTNSPLSLSPPVKRLKPPPLGVTNNGPKQSIQSANQSPPMPSVTGNSEYSSSTVHLLPPPPPPPSMAISPTSTVPLRRLSARLQHANMNGNTNGNTNTNMNMNMNNDQLQQIPQWVQSPESIQHLCSINESEVMSNNSLSTSVNSNNSNNINNSNGTYNKRSLSIIIAGPVTVTSPVSLLSNGVVAREIQAICERSTPKSVPAKIKNTPYRSNSFNAGIFSNNGASTISNGAPTNCSKSIHTFFTPAVNASIAQSLSDVDGDSTKEPTGMMCYYLL